MRRILAAGGLALFLAGCSGGASGVGTATSSRLVDLGGKPPYVNALDVDPATGDLLVTTNRGFWRIDPRRARARRITGRIAAGGRTDTVGTFLEIDVTPRGELIGSGHPDSKGKLESFLGLIRSRDGGRTWRPVSRYGAADLHKIVVAHGKMYAFDAVLGALLISADGGRSFAEHVTPRALVVDFVVDPGDASYILAATGDQLFRSEDGGRHWRPVMTAPGTRLAWPAPGVLVRADRDGAVYHSAQRGQGWQPIGRLPGEPAQLRAVSAREMYAALRDATIMHTTDGGRSWRTVFDA
jgi:hypothetical protein